jgi:uncharacterized protein YjbI with pentapeptide repeats
VAFNKANMRGALLESAHLTNSWFVNADFTDAFLWRADLSNAHFCSPSNSQFWETSFENAVLDEAILSGTQFCHTNLTGASLLNITLWDEQTNFADSNCDGVKFDKSSDFYSWGHAKFPSCFK